MALNHGPAAARAMLGDGSAYDRLPYFYSDQYDVGLEYLGYAPRWDRVVVRGNPADRAFVACYLLDGVVEAGLAVNVWDTVEPLRALITQARPVPEHVLADPAVPLEERPAHA